MDHYESEQDCDRPISAVDVPGGRLRFLYSRSHDSHATGGEGQDYIGWDTSSGALCFAVCDGVGSSFHGQLAARFLGRRLLEYLRGSGFRLAGYPGKEQVEGETREWLNRWQPDADAEVRRTPLPEGISSLLRRALEQLQREHGSETVFACGRLELGPPPGSLVLIWMGDTAVHLYDTGGRRIDLGGRWHNGDRWSTRFGAGKAGAQIWAWKGDARELDLARILVFSDGLASHAGELHALDNASLQQIVNEETLSPRSDDISFLDVALGDPPAAPQPRSAPDAPRLDALPSPDDAACYTLAWTQVDDAQYYILLERQPAVREKEIYLGRGHEHRVAGQPPGRYGYRVQAWGPGGASEMGEPVWITVALDRVRPAAPLPASGALLEVDAIQVMGAPALFPPPAEELPAAIEEEAAAEPPPGETPALREARAAGEPSPAAGAPASRPVPAAGRAAVEGGLPFVPTPQAPAGAGTPARPEPQGDEALLGVPILSFWPSPVVRVDAPFVVRWSSVPGAFGYELEVAFRAEGDPSDFQAAYLGPAVDLRGQAGRSGNYAYRVRALSGTRQGDWSEVRVLTAAAPIPATAPAPFPPAPAARPSEPSPGVSSPSTPAPEPAVQPMEGFRLTQSKSANWPTEFELAWTRPKGIQDCVVLESRSPDMSGAAELAAWGPGLRVAGRPPGTYYYRVHPRLGGRIDRERASNVLAVEVPLRKIEWRRCSPNVSRQEISVQLSWADVRHARLYLLWVSERRDFGGALKLETKQTLASVSVPEAGLYARVRAMGDAGPVSEWSKIAHITVKPGRPPQVLWEELY